MEEVINEPRFERLNISINDIEIRFKMLENLKLKAIATITFGDIIIKGFRVQSSDFGTGNDIPLWVDAPSFFLKGTYRPMFFIENKALWKAIEQKVIAEYHIQLNEHYEKRMETASDVSPEIEVSNVNFK